MRHWGRGRGSRLALGAALAGVSAMAQAGGSLELWGVKADYELQATYAAAMRVEKPSDGILNAPVSAKLPIPDFLKLPGGINSDDGDRNFKAGSLINNRASLLGEVLFKHDGYGVLLRGDAFYDNVYHRYNDNDSPDTTNKTGRVDEFTRQARHIDGGRARLLDAYAFGTFDLGDAIAVNLRAGQQVVAWGESLFFSGISLAQGPADGSAANVPGADVKSILLPVSQISLTVGLGDDWTLLGQYKLAYKATEVNPVGEYYSVSDVVGPGAQFAYGIKNPFYLDTLSAAHLPNDLLPALQTVAGLLNVPPSSIPSTLPAGLANLPQAQIPTTGQAALGAPKYINVPYAGEIKPSAHGQYGLGVKYQVTQQTEVGLYHLRYHSTLPAPVFSYGGAPLTQAQGAIPAITTTDIGLKSPTSYTIHHFDGIHMTAASFSTTLLGASVAGELVYRDGIEALVDVNAGVLGPIPTPTRARMSQADLNAIYLINPGYFWDGITLVGDVGYIHVNGVDPVSGPDPAVTSTKLSYSKNATAAAMLATMDIRNIFQGWDLSIPLTFQTVINGHSSLLGGFGSLAGRNDRHGSLGVTFTRYQRLSFNLSYNAYFGPADYTDRPLADRDNVSVAIKYGF
ncbi:MAG: DUF1302 family protein [Nevskiaceae bacterium]|nr:MAG: DUF1302 family protein [Nevskiaceae bacterium]